MKILIVLGVFCASASGLFGDSITVGVNMGGNAFPFGSAPSAQGTRYQEAYDKSLFAGPMSITGIEFFRTLPGGLYSGTFTLSFSTITAGVNTLSATNFNSNLGLDNTVFDIVALSGAAPSTLVFTGGPFLYNPAVGNLLLDIQIANPVNTGNAFFQDGNGSGPITIARYDNFGFGSIGYGLVTKFDFTTTVVPEPSTLIPMTLMVLLLGRKRITKALPR